MKEKLPSEARREVTARYLNALDHTTTVPASAFLEFPEELREYAKFRLTLALQSELNSLNAGKKAGKIVTDNRKLNVR